MVANLIRFSVFLSKRRAIYYALITHYNTFSQRFKTRQTVTVMMMRYNDRKQHDDAGYQHYVTDYVFLCFHIYSAKIESLFCNTMANIRYIAKKNSGRESPPSRTVVHGISISGLLILIIQANVWLGQ